MSFSWEEIKQAVEREESARLVEELEKTELREGHAPRAFLAVQRSRRGLEIAGAIVMGLYVAMITVILDFLVFNWILHVRFGI